MRYILLVLALAIPSYALANQCDDWLEPSFWSTATADRVEVCLEAHEIEAENEFGFRPLLLASIFTRNPQVIRVLIEHDADLERAIEPAGQTAFLFAILLNGRPEIIEIFLESKIDLEQQVDGLTALHLLATLVGNEKMAKSLQSDLQLVSLPGYASNLTVFAFRPDSSLISLLVDAGANINSGMSQGVTPLGVAAMINENPQTIDLLLEAGADVNMAADDGTTPLIWSNYASQNPTVGIQLIAAGANVNARNENGKTALFSAGYSKLESAELLATYVDALIEAGADINESTNALETPLHNAMHSRANPLLAKILIERGAELNPIDADGHTPLHHGVMFAYDLDRIVLLLSAGAEPSIKDNEGKMAWDYVQDNEDLTVLQKDQLRPMLELAE